MTILNDYFGELFWETILKDYFGGLFWATILGHYFGVLFWGAILGDYFRGLFRGLFLGTTSGEYLGILFEDRRIPEIRDPQENASDPTDSTR